LTALSLTLLSLILCGSVVYCILILVAARNYLKIPAPRFTAAMEPVSLIKPLFGADEGLEDNLRSFFQQDYPAFEMLLAVNRPTDPAAAVARRIMAEFPSVPARLVITGESPRPNGKVFSLQHMLRHAQHEILVMADSDIRVTPEMLRVLVAEMHDPAIGLVTCPYRAVPGKSFWSNMEAIGMNTEFLGGVLVARLLSGMDFALGCTLAVRRSALAAAGGLEALQNYLAEDFVMGRLVAESGSRVILSAYIIEHRIGSQSFGANFRHRLRWARSTRRSRPWGYVGEIFTNPLPLAVVLLALAPALWPLAAVTIALRIAAAWAVAGPVLHDPLIARACYLVPLQDFASFCTWIAGFFGNTIEWRGQRHTVLANGMFQTRTPSPATHAADTFSPILSAPADTAAPKTPQGP
jgi:ceramide glucosyltransferase